MPHNMTGKADASPILISATLLWAEDVVSSVVAEAAAAAAALAAAAAAAAAFRAIDSGGVEKCDDEEREVSWWWCGGCWWEPALSGRPEWWLLSRNLVGESVELGIEVSSNVSAMDSIGTKKASGLDLSGKGQMHMGRFIVLIIISGES